VRWGNVAQLAAVVVLAGLIAFGFPRGCGSEPEEIPLDALPGEPVETAVPPRFTLRPAVRRPPRDQRRRRPRPPRRRRAGLGRGAVAPAMPLVRRPRHASPRLWPRIPEAAREFSFDR